MYRLILPLPFSILLVYRRAFASSDDASRFAELNFSAFPGLEIWPETEVSTWKGAVITFPFGGSTPDA